jgi:hypothetical protein
MNIRVRLLTERELSIIADHGLHEALLATHVDEVRRALTALRLGLPSDNVCLDVAVDALSQLLRAQDRIRMLLDEVDALGGSSLSQEELLSALARWIIDNQIGRGFLWDPLMAPTRF